MAKAKISKADVTQTFNGQADIVLFDPPEGGYTKATTFADIVASGISLGQIVGDSTTWDGDDAEVETIVDEQGEVITAQPTAGTYAFSCDVANVSDDNLVLFMNGAKVTVAGPPVSFTNIKNLVKVGAELPVITRPIAIVNDVSDRFIIFPKAKIVASFGLDNKLWRIHISATAESIDTKELGTVMVGNGTPQYVEEDSTI